MIYISSSSFHYCHICVSIHLYFGMKTVYISSSISHSLFNFKPLNIPTFSLIVCPSGLCEVDHQNKAGYTAIMLAALTAAESPEDMEVAQQLLRMGKINARASQVHTARRHNIRYCKNTHTICYLCRPLVIPDRQF